jgi:hypothetical protein
MFCLQKWGKSILLSKNINYIDVDIDNIDLPIDKIQKDCIILLEIRRSALIFMKAV